MRPSISTLDGFTSRCSTPAACTAGDALGEAAREPDQVGARRSGPPPGPGRAASSRARSGWRRTASAPHGSASTISATHSLRIRRSEHDLAGQPRAGLVVADDVRAQHLERDPLAAGRRARWTTPMPPSPRRVSRVYPPTVRPGGACGRGTLGHAHERNRRPPDFRLSRGRVRKSRSADPVHPAERVVGAAVLDVDQRLADLHRQLAGVAVGARRPRRRPSGAGRPA